jgi:hypothetical protein
MSLCEAATVVRHLAVTKLNSDHEIEQGDPTIVAPDDITTCTIIIFRDTGRRAKSFRNDRDRQGDRFEVEMGL